MNSAPREPEQRNRANSRPRRRWPLRLALVSLALLLADQLANYAILRDGWLAGRRIAPFDPPLFMRAQFETIERLRAQSAGGEAFGDVAFDAELGWTLPEPHPSVDHVGGRIGASPLPVERTAGVRRIATFGCSFTYGSEVAPDESWPARLDAARDDLEVHNLGVPGYGIDQALLRYRRVADRLDVDEVWLGFLPATALRLVSTYRPALRHYTNTIASKPRFELDDADALTLIPHPADSLAALLDMLGDARHFGPIAQHDDFVRRWPAAYAPRGTHLAHWFATSRVLLTVFERGGRDWANRLVDPADQTRRLTDAILARFAAEVGARGDRFALVILPDHESLQRETTDAPPWSAVVAAARSIGIEVVDTTPWLAKRAHDPAMWAPQGHYSAEANALLANRLAALPR